MELVPIIYIILVVTITLTILTIIITKFVSYEKTNTPRNNEITKANNSSLYYKSQLDINRSNKIVTKENIPPNKKPLINYKKQNNKKTRLEILNKKTSKNPIKNHMPLLDSTQYKNIDLLTEKKYNAKISNNEEIFNKSTPENNIKNEKSS
ncbi:MAG: hypothetical protein N2249_04455 [Melioribacter sp.]|nr:hypothetical protein [Melioribacter sp.]